MNHRIYRYLLASSLVLGGCNDSQNEEDVFCTEQYVSGITIEVLDKETGTPIACNASAILEDNHYSEEVALSENFGECDNTQFLQAAGERSGIYNIHVSKEGYLDWSVYNIEVTSGQCHVNTVHIIAELEK